jgi:hypothetical protein
MRLLILVIGLCMTTVSCGLEGEIQDMIKQFDEFNPDYKVGILSTCVRSQETCTTSLFFNNEIYSLGSKTSASVHENIQELAPGNYGVRFLGSIGIEIDELDPAQLTEVIQVQEIEIFTL